MVATRLSEDPGRSVLLLEAGPDYPDFENLPDEIKFGYASGIDTVTTHHNWEFWARGTEATAPLQIPRGKVTGGSSAINGQVFLRGVPEDYDSWAAQGNDQWSYQNLLHYFRKMETDTEFGGSDFHNSDGPIVCRRFSREEWRPEAGGLLQRLPHLRHGRHAGLQPSRRHGRGASAAQQPQRHPAQHRAGLPQPGPAPAEPDHTAQLHRPPHPVRGQERSPGVQVESGGETFVVGGR